MENRLNTRSHLFAIVITMIGTFIVCTLALIYFFDWRWKDSGDLFTRNSEQLLFFTLRTALIATFLSSWAIWLGTKVINNFGVVMLCTGLGTLFSMTIYAVAGCGGVLGGQFSEIIFPAAFFAEYNFFTVMLEVAPVTSIATGLLLYCSLRILSPANKIMH